MYDGHGRKVARLSDDNRDGTLEAALVLACVGAQEVQEYSLASVSFAPESVGNAATSRDFAVRSVTPARAGVLRENIFGESHIDDVVVTWRNPRWIGAAAVLDDPLNLLTDAYGSVHALLHATGGKRLDLTPTRMTIK